MPLTHLVKAIGNAPADVIDRVGKLRFRNTIIVYLHINGTDLFPDNWLYVHSAGLRTGRITNFRNWVPQLSVGDTTILALEFWCNSDDMLWQMNDSQLVDLAREDLSRTGLSRNYKVTEGAVYRIPKSYPVYEKNYKHQLEPVERWLDTIGNLSPIGRYGAFKYNNQDHSILMGILASENIADNKAHNLWEVNTDYDSYQEDCAITKSGLVMKTTK
jgi:protoporphyrinogen oxidase